MDIVTAIIAAAKTAGVSGVLLLAICSHESGGFRQNYNPFDVNSPSWGSCQLKEKTAFMFNFHGLPFELMDPKINARMAAKYLQYQQKRYGENWVQMTAAYNAGSYIEGSIPNCPINLKYIELVQKKLPVDLQERLQCGTSREFAENE